MRPEDLTKRNAGSLSAYLEKLPAVKNLAATCEASSIHKKEEI
jgi:hypothetical protein